MNEVLLRQYQFEYQKRKFHLTVNVQLSYHLRQMSPVISITIPTKMATAIIMAMDIPCELFTAPQIVSLASPSSPARVS